MAAARRKWRFIGHQQFGCPKGAVYTTELRWEFRQKPAALALLYCKQIATRLFSTFSSRNWPINSKWARKQHSAEKITEHLVIKSGYLNCIRSAATAQDSSYFVSTPFCKFCNLSFVIPGTALCLWICTCRSTQGWIRCIVIITVACTNPNCSWSCDLK